MVAEAAFQGPQWLPGLEGVAEFANLRIVRCVVDPAIANERYRQRAARNPRRAHAHASTPMRRAIHPFQPITIDAPSINVDTTDGYDPGLADIVAFVDRR